MNKLVCESLQEFNILMEAQGDSHGPIGGIWKVIKSAPGRALRRARARQIMEKYRRKISEKFDKVIEKYQQNLENLIIKTENSINNIDKTKSDSIQARQHDDILDGLVDDYKEILNHLKTSMLEQLKIYSDSIHQRLESPGTITGSEFLPEDKTTLLSEWKLVESDINYEIQKRLINILDHPFITKYTELKAELKEYIEDKLKGGYYHKETDEDSNENTLKDNDQIEIYKTIERMGDIDFDTPYEIIHTTEWKNQVRQNMLAPQKGSYVAFKIDNKRGKAGYAFYEKDHKKPKNRPIKVTQDIIYLIEPNEGLTEGKAKIGFIKKCIGK